MLHAAVRVGAAQVCGPQLDVLLLDAHVHAVYVLGVGGGDDAEHGAVARMGEEELVQRVEERSGLIVDLARGAEQGVGDIVRGRRGCGPPEGIGGDEGEGVDAVAELARQRQQQGEGRVGRGRGAKRRRGGVLGGAGADGRGGRCVVHGRIRGAAAGG